MLISAPPDKILLDDGQRQYRAAECQHAIAAIAALLKAEGLAPGDCVALLSRNRADYPLWLLGAVVAGLWVVPVNWHLKADEVAHIVKDSGARLLLVEPELSEVVPDTRHWLLDESRWRHATPAELRECDPVGGIMLYTSGTTGRPKGVRRSQPATLGELLQQWRQQGRAVGLDGDGPHLVTGPLYHAAPLLYALYDWVNGAAMLIMPRFEAEEALRWIQRYRVRHSHWVPTMFVRALRLPQALREQVDLSSLTLVLHGAAPVAAETKQQMIEWWGPVLVEYWGGSESGAVTRVDSHEWLAHPGTVGRALPRFEVFAVDSDGQPLPANQTGLLAVRARDSQRIFSYFNDPDKTERSHIGDALTLGDIGYIDERGYVFLLDRESHTIISGGVNIYPAEVEAVLSTHPAVADVLVCGETDPEWGERVVAKVLPLENGTTELAEDLLTYAARYLANYKLPRRIDWVTRLPRTDTGKLYRRNL